MTRKLIQDGKTPLLVGLWFSLGHSAVVIIMCSVVAAGSAWARTHMANAQDIGAIVGTVVSSTVLFLIGGANPRRPRSPNHARSHGH